MIIVSPFKPLPRAHRSQKHSPEKIGEFDWVDALRMLSKSAERFGYPVYAITDSDLPVPHFKLKTKESNLMLWILEVSLAYIESEYFTEDTAFVCPDSLINNFFPTIDGFDIAVCVRFDDKYVDRPILNSVQLWTFKGRKKLAKFYRQCLEVARKLPGGPEWGADTIPLEQLLAPLKPGYHHRAGVNVLMFPASQMLRTIHKADIEAVNHGIRPRETGACVIDFKADRKKHMKAFFNATHNEATQ